MKIVCFDEEDDTLAGIESGDIYGTVVQQPFEFGKQSMLNGQVSRRRQISHSGGQTIFIPTRAIKKDNVDDFQTDNLKKTPSGPCRDISDDPDHPRNCTESAKHFPA